MAASFDHDDVLGRCAPGRRPKDAARRNAARRLGSRREAIGAGGDAWGDAWGNGMRLSNKTISRAATGGRFRERAQIKSRRPRSSRGAAALVKRKRAVTR